MSDEQGVGQGAMAGAVAAAPTLNPWGIAAGAAIGAGGALLSARGKRKEAEAKAAALARWKERRAALANALMLNYNRQGMEAQQGLGSQVQSLGSGEALRKAYAEVPDYAVTGPVSDSPDAARAAAYNAVAARNAGDANLDFNLQVARARDAAYRRQQDVQAQLANAGVRFNAPSYDRERFLNGLQVSQADADFQREFGDVPNSAANQQLLGSILSGLAPTAVAMGGRGMGAGRSA